MLLHQGRNEGVGPVPLLRMLYVARELLARIGGLYVLTENKVEFPVLKFTHYSYFPRRQNPTLLHKKGGALGEGSFALRDLCFSHCWSSHALFPLSKAKTLPFKGILLQGKLPHLWNTGTVQTRDANCYHLLRPTPCHVFFGAWIFHAYKPWKKTLYKHSFTDKENKIL